VFIYLLIGDLFTDNFLISRWLVGNSLIIILVMWLFILNCLRIIAKAAYYIKLQHKFCSLDLTSCDSSSNAGLSVLGGVCGNSPASINEFGDSTVLAHELGHKLVVYQIMYKVKGLFSH